MSMRLYFVSDWPAVDYRHTSVFYLDGMQLRRFCVANTPNLMSKYAEFGLQLRRNWSAGECKPQ